MPNKPLPQAVALAYQAGEGAPRVVAKGKGPIAEEIMARAREHGVFMHESKELVALLMQVDLDREIPPDLYRAVAELLAWIYRIESGLTEGMSAQDIPPLSLPSPDGDKAADEKDGWRANENSSKRG